MESDVYGHLGSTLREMEEQIKKLELPLSLTHFERMKAAFDSDERKHALSPDWLTHNLAELTTRIIDELEQRLFLNVPVHQAPLYIQPRPLFDAEVDKQFPQMSEDVSEAGKCLALNRNTAAVFHLMRVMEIGVQLFGTKLKVPLAGEKNWQDILNRVNTEMKNRNHKLPETKALAEIASHLYNVKVAWRNEVMHPKQTYTDEEATAIFRNVRTFIVDLTGVL